jgi:hypothetical protein
MVAMPTDVDNMIRSFMNKMDFCVGSLDVIVDKFGEYWFLECNPEGAWAWLDQISGGKISLAFANFYESKIRKMRLVDGEGLVDTACEPASV